MIETGSHSLCRRCMSVFTNCDRNRHGLGTQHTHTRHTPREEEKCTHKTR